MSTPLRSKLIARAAEQPAGFAPNIHVPPSASRIAFHAHMNLPPPFIPNSLDAFNSCHLPAMSDLTFFTNDAWTGCISIVSHVSSVGGPHQDGFAYGSNVGSPGHFPHERAFEGVVQFSATEHEDSGDSNNNMYELQSNNFCSEGHGSLHRLHLRINNKTGQLLIHHWHPMIADLTITDGFITPFCIVSGLLPGAWLWRWKAD